MDPEINQQNTNLSPQEDFGQKPAPPQEKVIKGGKKVSALDKTDLTEVAKKTPRPTSPTLPPDIQSTVQQENTVNVEQLEQNATITNYLGEDTISNQGTDETPHLEKCKKSLTLALHRHQIQGQNLKELRSELEALQDKYPSEVLKEMPQTERSAIQKQIREAKQKVWDAKKEFDEAWMQIANLKSEITNLEPEFQTQRKPPPEVLKLPSKPLTKPAAPKEESMMPLLPQAQIIRDQKERKVCHFKLMDIDNRLKQLTQELVWYPENKEEIEKNMNQLKEEKQQISEKIAKLDDDIGILYKAAQSSIESEFAFIRAEIETCELNLQVALASGDPQKIQEAREKLEKAKQDLTDTEARLNPQLKKLKSDQQFIKQTDSSFKPVLERAGLELYPIRESNMSTTSEPSDRSETKTSPAKDNVTVTSDTSLAYMDKGPMETTTEAAQLPQDILNQPDLQEQNILPNTIQPPVITSDRSDPSKEIQDQDVAVIKQTAVSDSKAAAAVQKEPDARVSINPSKAEASGISVQKAEQQPKASKSMRDQQILTEQPITLEEIRVKSTVLTDKKLQLNAALKELRESQERLAWAVDGYDIELKQLEQLISDLPTDVRKAILSGDSLEQLEKSSPELHLVREQVLKRLQVLVHLYQTVKAREIEYQQAVASVEKRARILEQEWKFFEEKSDQIRELYPGNILRKPPQIKEADKIRKEPMLSIDQAISKSTELVIMQNAIERAQAEGGAFTVALNLAAQMPQQQGRNLSDAAGRAKAKDEQNRDEIETAERGSDTGKGGSEGGEKRGGSGERGQEGGSSQGRDEQGKDKDEQGKDKEKSSGDDEPEAPGMSGRNVRIVKVK